MRELTLGSVAWWMCLAGVLSLALLVQDWPLIAVLTAAALLIRFARRHVVDFVLIALLATVWAVIIQLGLLRFSLFEQAMFLLDQNVQPFELLARFDLWGPRYVISYPAVWVSTSLRIGINEAFTLYGGALLAAETYVLAKTAQYAFRTPGRRDLFISAAAFTITLATIGSFMNGRLAAAHLGIAVILLAQVAAVRSAVSVGTWVLHGIGLFLTMMTSGTAIVGSTQVAIAPLILFGHWSSGVTRRSLIALPVLVLLMTAWPIISAGVEKNLDFWGGGVNALTNMLEHGWGSWLVGAPAIVGLAALACLGYMLLGSWVCRRNKRVLPLTINIPIAMGFGMYGYSTATMALPAAIVLAYVVLRTPAGITGILSDRTGLQEAQKPNLPVNLTWSSDHPKRI